MGRVHFLNLSAVRLPALSSYTHVFQIQLSQEANGHRGRRSQTAQAALGRDHLLQCFYKNRMAQVDPVFSLSGLFRGLHSVNGFNQRKRVAGYQRNV